MDFQLSEEQELFRKSVRDFVGREVAPVAAVLDERGEFPMALFRRCGELGYFGLRYPEAVGGMGADFTTFCLMAEEIARGSLSLAAAVSMQCLMGTDFVYRFGTDDHKTRLLASALRGEKIGTIAMTEPDFGSDLGGITTRAVKDGDGWVLTGRKMWITSATVADFFTVAAKTGPEAGFKGIDMFLVEREMPGLTVGKRIEKMGVRASETSELILESVRVPAAISASTRCSCSLSMAKAAVSSAWAAHRTLANTRSVSEGSSSAWPWATACRARTTSRPPACFNT